MCGLRLWNVRREQETEGEIKAERKRERDDGGNKREKGN